MFRSKGFIIYNLLKTLDHCKTMDIAVDKVKFFVGLLLFLELWKFLTSDIILRNYINIFRIFWN